MQTNTFLFNNLCLICILKNAVRADVYPVNVIILMLLYVFAIWEKHSLQFTADFWKIMNFTE